MRAATLEKLIWVLIFGGMLLSTLGLSLLRGGTEGLAWTVLLAGAVATLVGVVLIFVRARMKADGSGPRGP
jgi:ABC-type glycerol-3-phosphate transport system permease component